MRRGLSAIVGSVLAAGGCASSIPSGEPARSPTGDWYHAARALDLTGDGVADSVVLRAAGPSPDSLEITLSIRIDGQTAHQETWRSDYELIDVDWTVRIRPRLDQYLRARLDTVLASMVIEPLDREAVRLMADDTTVVTAIRPEPRTQISYSYGYETSTVLAWDGGRRRLVQLWSCC